MAIVDLSYITEKCETDNTMILIDSSQRDLKKYTSSSEYVIEFNEPIKLVHGVDVLDAMIPNTSYVIETKNNLLSFAFIYPPLVNLDLNSLRDIYDVPQNITSKSAGVNYCFQHFIGNYLYELQSNTDFSRAFYFASNEDIQYQIVLTTQADFNNFFTDIQDKLSSEKPLRITNDSTQIFVRKTQKIKNLTKIFNNSYSETNSYKAVLTSNKNEFVVEFHDMISNFDNELQRAIDLNHYLINESDKELIYYISFWTSKEEDLVSMVNSFQNTLTFEEFYTKQQTFILFMYNKHLEPGNYEFISKEEGVTFSTALQNIFQGPLVNYKNSTNFSALATFEIESIPLNGVYKYRSEVPYMLLGLKSTIGDNLGIKYFKKDPSSYCKLSYDDDSYIFLSIIDTVGVFNFSGDGVVRLKTTPYVILRCAEIEDSINRTFPYGKQGFGVFKLLSANQTSHLRFDFTNFAKKPFHPISKLQRLSIRFEYPDGSLFDFKGVNHMLILNFKHYVPKKSTFDQFPLNPNYNADYQTYLIEHLNNENEFKQEKINEHLPKTSEYINDLRNYNSSVDSTSCSSSSSEDESSTTSSVDFFN